jgi:hypothetical protein
MPSCMNTVNIIGIVSARQCPHHNFCREVEGVASIVVIVDVQGKDLATLSKANLVSGFKET